MKRLVVHKKHLIMIVLGVMILASAFIFWKRSNSTDPPGDVVTVGDLARGEINYGPPTEEEKDQAEQNKDKVSERIALEQSQQTPSDTSSKKAVTPSITQAEQVDSELRMAAFVGGIFENDGNCIFRLSKGKTTITRETKGFGNVSTTNCERLVIGRSELPEAGDWSLTVEYSSSTAQGMSGATTVEVN